MKNAVALVTGGASGLGKFTVQHLLKHGFKVALLDLPSSNGAFLSRLLNQNCAYIQADIANDEEVKNGLSKVKDKFGHLDIVVNCAGISFNRKAFSFITPNSDQKATVMSDLGKMLSVNVGGTFNVIRHALHLLTENDKDEMGCRGIVINTSSFSSFEPQLGQVFDSLCSGALNSATLSLSKDYASVGVRFVTIAPGIFRTPLVISHMNEMNLEDYERMVQLPSRLGLPEEFAALVLHIIQNRYLNGEVIRLDGSLRMPL
ncbi:unnamed protein product [Thelazia callipaeda]|uniref:3-hydroxyacyl-CoA dehydrogenase type-2 n=1 Tax=Thelazia callipaeda TaxID=103827 RepID=A0A0N5CL06_THECL|nr:unnamed protein product [Thelazia callipaeda]